MVCSNKKCSQCPDYSWCHNGIGLSTKGDLLTLLSGIAFWLILIIIFFFVVYTNINNDFDLNDPYKIIKNVELFFTNILQCHYINIIFLSQICNISHWHFSGLAPLLQTTFCISLKSCLCQCV